MCDIHIERDQFRRVFRDALISGIRTFCQSLDEGFRAAQAAGPAPEAPAGPAAPSRPSRPRRPKA